MVWFWLEPNFGVTASYALGVAGTIFGWAGFGSAVDVTDVFGLVAAACNLDAAGFGAASSFLITRLAVVLIILIIDGMRTSRNDYLKKFARELTVKISGQVFLRSTNRSKDTINMSTTDDNIKVAGVTLSALFREVLCCNSDAVSRIESHFPSLQFNRKVCFLEQ